MWIAGSVLSATRRGSSTEEFGANKEGALPSRRPITFFRLNFRHVISYVYMYLYALQHPCGRFLRQGSKLD